MKRQYLISSQTTLYLQLLILILIFTPQHSISQNSLNTSFISGWQKGPCFAVAVTDNLCLSGNGCYLEIRDISDPENPVLLSSKLMEGFVNSIEINDQYAFVAMTDIGLIILDISKPDAITELSFLEIKGFYPHILIFEQTLYYKTNSSLGLNVVDISKLAEPVLVRSLAYSSESWMAQYDKYLYMASGWAGLIVLDLNDALNPVEVNIMQDIYAYNICIYEENAFLAAGDSLLIFDLSDAPNPEKVATIYADTYWSIYSCAVNNEILTLTESQRIKNYSILEIDNPQLLSDYTCDSFDKFHMIRNFNGRIYGAKKGDGLFVLNISDPSIPFMDFESDTPDNSVDISLMGNRAFVANDRDGIYVLDIEDPSHIKWVNHLPVALTNNKLHIQDDFLYLLNRYLGLLTIDITDPDNPVIIDTLDLDLTLYDMAVEGQLAYIAHYPNGISIVDLSDPNDPVHLSTFEISGSIRSVAVQNELVIIGTNDEGIRMVDVSDSTNPNEISFMDTVGRVESVAIHDNIVIVGNPSNFIRIIDITDPLAPIVRSKYFTARARSIQIDNSIAYVAAGYNGIFILDISNPEEPEKIGYFNSDGSIYRFQRKDNLIYLADYNAGISIIEYQPVNTKEIVSDLSSPLFIQSIYPNPVRDHLTLKLQIPERSAVKIQVFDLNGKILHQNMVNYGLPGSYLYTWELKSMIGEKIPPGSYIVKVIIGNQRQSKIFIVQ